MSNQLGQRELVMSAGVRVASKRNHADRILFGMVLTLALLSACSSERLVLFTVDRAQGLHDVIAKLEVRTSLTNYMPVRIDPGRHRVTFRRAGLADSNRDVVLSPGQRLRLPDLALVTLSLGPPSPPPRKPIWRRWPFWAAVGTVAILGGVAAIYLSNRSDRPPCTATFCVPGD